MTPNFIHKTQDIPGVGIVNFGTEIKEKPFDFEISTKGTDKADLQHKLRTFISFLFDGFGKPRDIKLTYNYETDKFYTVKVASNIDPERALKIGKFNLKFIAYDPYAYSDIFADEITWGSEVLTFQSYYLLGHEGSVGMVSITSPRILDITVSGLAIKPIIEINGSASNLVLSANVHSISFDNFTNSNWNIDCAKYTVMKNGINSFGEVGLREFILMPGNNQIAITGSGIDIDIRIRYRDKY